MDSNQFIQVLLPLPFSEPFTYTHPTPLKTGTYVEVTFGQKKIIGIVIGSEKNAPSELKTPLKAIVSVLSFPVFSSKFFEFLKWAAQYYVAKTGLVLKMALPLPFAEMTKNQFASPNLTSISSQDSLTKHMLSSAQKNCADTLIATLEENRSQVFFLEGVTGSGKTEVYFAAIATAMQQGKQVLVLVPEIALTHQWIHRFHKHFGIQPTVWHSDLSPKKRRLAWHQIIAGQTPVVLGARSAVFLPFQNLGLIIVDEEHDATYKQEFGVLYQGRDMAVTRAHFEQCPAILVSATPSLESLHNIQRGKYHLLSLTQRYAEAQLPDVHLIDLKKVRMKSTWISEPLHVALKDTLSSGHQALLFLNKRGYSPFLICTSCGLSPHCPNCDTSLVFHKKVNLLRCHYCAYKRSFNTRCPDCLKTDSLKPCGPGVERLEEEVKTLFPHTTPLIMSSDTLSSPQQAEKTFSEIAAGTSLLIIGTQIMAKGHHFPKLTLVGIIDGDLSLHGTDLRASERTYQLLTQVSGRAGREHVRGNVYIQTHAPDQPIMQALKTLNQTAFLESELAERQRHYYPPFGALATLTIIGSKEKAVEHAARQLASYRPSAETVTVLGPSPAIITKLKKQYRWQFLIKSTTRKTLQHFIGKWIEINPLQGSVQIRIDIDPYTFT